MTGSPVKRKCPANSTFEKVMLFFLLQMLLNILICNVFLIFLQIETSVSKKRRVADEAKAHDGVKGIRMNLWTLDLT